MATLVNVIEVSKKHCKFPIKGELAYATPNNFVGKILDGYHADALKICLLTTNAAKALCDVQNHLIESHKVGLFFFDGYRPARAVKDIVKWSKLPPENMFEIERKILHYPNIEKNQLFELGYVSADSNHCYGNTVDLTLIDLKSGEFKNMGSIFDYMDKKSHLTETVAGIGEEAFQNREILVNAMKKFDFEPYVKEYWHFSHGGVAGREVSTPIDIEISPDLQDKVEIK